MTWRERVEALSQAGLTERQAGFLVTVMLHSGVCLSRHYCDYAGIGWGRKAQSFLGLLVSRKYATYRPCGNQGARLYHVHHRPLYRAIGEENNRHRKPMSLGRAIERLMLLDTVIADRARVWLATEGEKVTHFTLQFPVPRQDLPQLVFTGGESDTVRFFPDKLPIGVGPDGPSYVLLYAVTRRAPVDFRSFLERHAELMRALPRWSIRLIAPRHLAGFLPAYRAAFDEQLARPLRPAVLDELRWFFQARRASPRDVDERFFHASRAFATPRFTALYRAWLERGDTVLDATLSSTLKYAITRGTGGLDCHVLPYRYLHLVPLVGTA